MFKENQYVLYKHDVCKITSIKKNSNSNKNYYVLVPITDESLKIEVPVDNSLGNIKKLITKNKIKELIKEIPNIKPIDINSKMIDSIYKSLLDDGSYESLIKIIKTAYLINKERLDNRKKIRDKDDQYFKLAEKYLYNEISVVLGMSYDETKRYIVEEVEKIDKNEK